MGHCPSSSGALPEAASALPEDASALIPAMCVTAVTTAIQRKRNILRRADNREKSGMVNVRRFIASPGRTKENGSLPASPFFFILVAQSGSIQALTEGYS